MHRIAAVTLLAAVVGVSAWQSRELLSDKANAADPPAAGPASQQPAPATPGPSTPLDAASPRTTSLRAAKFDYVGTASCTAKACHGDTHRDRVFPAIWGNEHTVWVERDPHARAFAVLHEQPSEDMARYLELKAGPRDAVQCLSCHAPGGVETSRDTVAQGVSLADGVDCEACHGPASGWLAEHTQAGWRRMTALEKQAHGFENLQSLTERAEVCAACHVGSKGRDVNHDLIAAGHPRLNFEMGGHLARIPKHWTERKRTPDFEARVWAIGQVAAARAAIDLLASRAADKSKPWPEFAEYDCFGCHHQLQHNSWRQPADGRLARDGFTRLGQPTWGSWYLPLIRAGHVPAMPLKLRDDLDPLAEQMQAIFSTTGRNEVAEAAVSAAKSLDAWLAVLDGASLQEQDVRSMLTSLAQDGPQLAGQNWDAAAQFYLAIVAQRQALADLGGNRQTIDALHPALFTLRESLAFPATDASGANRQLLSPRDFEPNRLEAALLEIQRLLKNQDR